MRRPLALAFFLSMALHVGLLASPGWQSADMPTSAPRIMAQLAAAQAEAAADKPQESASMAPVKRPRPAPQPPVPDAPTVQMPQVPDVPDVADAAESVPVADESAVTAESRPASESGPVATSEPVALPALAEESAPLPDPSEPTLTVVSSVPVAQRLPRQGRVRYTGTAGAFVALTAMGEASWEHDGVRFQSRLSAGLSSPDSQLDFRSTGRLVGPQMISETTHDNRRGKISTGQIDQAGGKVMMQRGSDTRERDIRGLAVAISALPQMLATLDDSVESAAFFVVGDFWVADSIVSLRGKENLIVPGGAVETRHYATRAKNGTLIDVWLAPKWHNAPARIRIETADGIVVDLKATDVEIEGKVLAHAPGPKTP